MFIINLISCIVVIMDTTPINPGIREYLSIIDKVFVFIYLAEFIIKIFAYGISGYFENDTNK